MLAEVHTQSVLKEVRDKDPNASNYSTYNTREFFATQMQVLKSRDLTERVQNRLKLTENPKWKAGLDLPANAKPSELMEQTLYRLKSGFGISRERHARVIRLSYDHNDPLLTAEIVHAFAEEYVGKSSSQRTTSQKRAHLWLQTEEERLRSELRSVEQEIDAFKRSEGLLSADTENSRTLRWASLSRLQQEADRLNILASRLSEELTALESMDMDGKAAAIIKVNVERSPVMGMQAEPARSARRTGEAVGALQRRASGYQGDSATRLGAAQRPKSHDRSDDRSPACLFLESVRKQRTRVLGALQSGRGEVLNINGLEQVHSRLVHRQTNLQKMLSSVADQPPNDRDGGSARHQQRPDP